VERSSRLEEIDEAYLRLIGRIVGLDGEVELKLWQCKWRGEEGAK